MIQLYKDVFQTIEIPEDNVARLDCNYWHFAIHYPLKNKGQKHYPIYRVNAFALSLCMSFISLYSTSSHIAISAPR